MLHNLYKFSTSATCADSEKCTKRTENAISTKRSKLSTLFKVIMIKLFCLMYSDFTGLDVTSSEVAGLGLFLIFFTSVPRGLYS